MRMLRAIIFDMDGVLINSTKYNHKSFQILLKQYKVHLPNTSNKKYIGRSLRDQIKMWKEDYHIQEEIDCETFSRQALKLQLSFMKNRCLSLSAF